MNSTTKTPALSTECVGRQLTLTFSDGRTLALEIGELSQSIIDSAIVHGLKQKLADAAAISRDPTTGRTATIDTKYDAVREVFDRITSADGTWNKQREGGSGGSGGLLHSALVQMYAGRKTPSELAEFLKTKTPAEQAALRKTPRIAEIIEEIKAARADGPRDGGEDLLAELED